MKCIQCGKEFEAARSTAQYCSGACRVKFNRVSVTELEGQVSVTPLSVTDPQGVSVTDFSVTDAGEADPVQLDQIPGLSIPTPTNQVPNVEPRPGMRRLTDDDMAALPTAVVRPLCRQWAPIDCSDEQLQGMIPSHSWQSSPEYAERIHRLLHSKTTWNLPAWAVMR